MSFKAEISYLGAEKGQIGSTWVVLVQISVKLSMLPFKYVPHHSFESLIPDVVANWTRTMTYFRTKSLLIRKRHTNVGHTFPIYHPQSTCCIHPPLLWSLPEIVAYILIKSPYSIILFHTGIHFDRIFDADNHTHTSSTHTTRLINDLIIYRTNQCPYN